MITRRQLALGTSAALLGGTLASGGRTVLAAPGIAGALGTELADIEAKSGGRLGVAVFDTHSGTGAGHRADERFPLCSTFKLLAAAAVLARVDAGKENLDRQIEIDRTDIVVYSPITEQHVGRSMSLAALCEAAMTVSDNTAGNLLLATLGGPQGVTAYARSLGDATTRLDRIEPDLNEAVPGDPRDTTSPSAMLGDLRTLVLGGALSAPSRDRLIDWLIANKTGDTRLRAGLPAQWRVGDKTGSGARGTTNAIGIAWPPERTPILVTAYLTETEASKDRRDGTLAAVGRAVASWVAGS
jgi:beta-lactamase class A